MLLFAICSQEIGFLDWKSLQSDSLEDVNRQFSQLIKKEATQDGKAHRAQFMMFKKNANLPLNKCKLDEW